MESIEKIANKIHSSCMKCYLDTAAMSLMPEEVQEALKTFHQHRNKYGPDFMKFWEEVDFLRRDVSSLIQSTPEEIMFLQNTSLGINLVAHAINLVPGDNVVITNLEFPSNVYPWMNLRTEGIEVRMLDIKDGVLDEKKLSEICDERTKILSISWVQSTNGMVTDINTCSKFCKQNNIYFALDAIQGLGVLPLNVKKLHIDFIISGFFKWMLGPDGLAFVYINKKILSQLNIPFTGWAGMKNRFDYTNYCFDLPCEARRFETGNMNFSAIYGARQGLRIILKFQSEITRKVQDLTTYLREQVNHRNYLLMLSPVDGESAGITLIGCENSKKTYDSLKSNNIIVNYKNGLRVSVHFYNSKKDIDNLLGALDTIYNCPTE